MTAISEKVHGRDGRRRGRRRGPGRIVLAHARTACSAATALGARLRRDALLFDDEAGGNANADDPAIWRNAEDPDRSLVTATAKEGGLCVYDLDTRCSRCRPAAAPGGDAPAGSTTST
ncbi:phytase [Streptomyces sp. MMS21 TC-5]|uniref:phytase n=1 Tax=Streptomyces sp. MMS21 TC-5 TaxID=2925833 RepID=UPI001F61E02A|nr:phytase [Streptomyces sp. MMS21 TC-5]MCI4086116.1 phytase [Streptomyces sp. MMS21 TC-5]